ncbi:hypothetical protein K2P56_00845 [Patescibacteria group bacterium]|nr:hypothetical protein [Patescibacteria group bacterium]
MGRKIRQIMDGEVALPFRTKDAGILSFITPIQQKAFFVSGILFVLLSVLYVYSVIASVMHVAAREELTFEATRLSSEVARLEAEYLSRTEGITESFARERGYTSISSRSFVERTSSVTFNNAR